LLDFEGEPRPVLLDDYKVLFIGDIDDLPLTGDGDLNIFDGDVFMSLEGDLPNLAGVLVVLDGDLNGFLLGD
jgi:hypothetical protein